MSTDINLLLRTDEESLKQKRRVKIFNVAAGLSLGVIILMSLGIFMMIQIVNPDLIKTEQEKVLVKMSQFQNRQAKLFVANDRVENIDKILNSRKDISKITDGLLAKVPSSLVIDSLEVDSKTVAISGQSRSLFTIGEFINNLTDMVRNKEIIKSLTLNSLILDTGKGTYQISLKSEL